MEKITLNKYMIKKAFDENDSVIIFSDIYKIFC